MNPRLKEVLEFLASVGLDVVIVALLTTRFFGSWVFGLMAGVVASPIIEVVTYLYNRRREEDWAWWQREVKGEKDL